MKIIKSPKIDARNSFKKKLLLVGIALLLLSVISLTAQTSKHSFQKAYGRIKPVPSRLYGLTLTKDNKKEVYPFNGFLPLKHQRTFPELFYGSKKLKPINANDHHKTRMTPVL